MMETKITSDSNNYPVESPPSTASTKSNSKIGRIKIRTPAEINKEFNDSRNSASASMSVDPPDRLRAFSFADFLRPPSVPIVSTVSQLKKENEKERKKMQRRRYGIQNAIDITNEVGKLIDEPTAFAFFKHQIDNFEIDAKGNAELAEEYLFRAIKFFHQWSLEMEMPRSRFMDEGRLDVESNDFSWFCCVCCKQFSPNSLVDHRMFHYIGKPHWKMFVRLLKEKGVGGSSRMAHAVTSIRTHDWTRWTQQKASKKMKVDNESEKEVIEVDIESEKEVIEVDNESQKEAIDDFGHLFRTVSPEELKLKSDERCSAAPSSRCDKAFQVRKVLKVPSQPKEITNNNIISMELPGIE